MGIEMLDTLRGIRVGIEMLDMLVVMGRALLDMT